MSDLSNPIWFIYSNECIYIRTWLKQFRIDNKEIVQMFLDVFPFIKERVVSNKDYKYIREEQKSKFNLLNNKLINTIKLQYMEKPKIKYDTYNLLLISDKPQNVTEFFDINLLRYNEKKRVWNDIDIIYFLKEDISELNGILNKINSKRLNVIFTLENVCYLLTGDKESIILKLKLFENKKVSNIYDYELFFIAFNKINSLRNNEKDFLNLKIYTIEKDKREVISEILGIVNLTSCLPESINLKDLTFEKVGNEKFFKMDSLVKQMKLYIYQWEFSDIKQIPFNVSVFKYKQGVEKEKVYVSGKVPDETYNKTFNIGFADMINYHEKEKFSKWVVADNKDELYCYGIIPILFKAIENKEHEGFVTKKYYKVNHINNIVTKLIKEVEDDFNLEDLFIEVTKINNTKFMKIALKNFNDENIIKERYGVNEKGLIEDILIEFYAMNFQNHLLKENIKNISSLKKKITLNDISEISEENEEVNLDESLEKVLGYISNKITINEWEYNIILNGTGKKCFKVSIK